MYNKLEKEFYNIKEDCIFNNSCLIQPNNHSFVNYKRPSTNGSFLSENIKTVINKKGCHKINCECVSSYK